MNKKSLSIIFIAAFFFECAPKPKAVKGFANVKDENSEIVSGGGEGSDGCDAAAIVKPVTKHKK